jgi:hypothetical protein
MNLQVTRSCVVTQSSYQIFSDDINFNVPVLVHFEKLLRMFLPSLSVLLNRIRDPDPVFFYHLNPGSEMGKKTPDHGFGIRNKHPESYFRQLRNNYFGSKCLNSMFAVLDPGPGAF